MILGLDILLKLVKEIKLVENLAERELNHPEGTGFDLRAGILYELDGPGYLDIDSRDTSPTKKIATYVEGNSQKILIRKQTSYLVQTIERVNMPKSLVALVKPRTTLFRSGVSLDTAIVSPGYEGELTFGVYARNFDFTLEMGARIAHIIFADILGDATLYKGQWQGGRVSTSGIEKQI